VPDRKVIDDFLAQHHLAFVGVSRDTRQFANTVYRHLRSEGRVLYPVNAAANGVPIEGDQSFPTLAAVPDPVDGVIVMVPGPSTIDVVRDAVDRGIPRVWLHRSGGPPVPREAVQLCRDSNVAVVDGACPLMFAEPVRGFHRLHRFVSGRRVAV